MTLPRYVAATRPGSEQLVVERDPACRAARPPGVAAAAGTGIEIRINDGRTAVETGPATTRTT